MPVQVHLRGIMLFCCKNGQLTEVLLPDGQQTPAEGTGNSTAMKHLDSSDAGLHWTGLHVPNQNLTPYHLFRNAKVTMRGSTNDLLQCAGLSALPKLDHDLWQVDRAGGAHGRSEVTISGASDIQADYRPDRKFKFEGREVHDQVTVTFDRDVRIQIGREPEIHLTAGDAYLYNFDEPLPDVNDLTDGHDTDRDIVVDDDFKWVYSVLRPRSGKSRKQSTGGFLPAPVSAKRADSLRPMTIFVSTCFPAVLDDE